MRLAPLALTLLLVTGCGEPIASPGSPAGDPAPETATAPPTPLATSPSADGDRCYRRAVRLDRTNLGIVQRRGEGTEYSWEEWNEYANEAEDLDDPNLGLAWPDEVHVYTDLPGSRSFMWEDFEARRYLRTNDADEAVHVRWEPAFNHESVEWSTEGEDGGRGRVVSWAGKEVCNTLD